VFARAAGGFRAVAVEGSIRPYLLGGEIDERVFRFDVPRHDTPVVAALQAALCMRNLEYTGVVGLKLLLEAELAASVRPARVRAGVRGLAMEARRCGIEPTQLVVQLSKFAALSSGVAAVALDELRGEGIGIALEENGDGLAFNGLPRLALPDVIAVNSSWFRSIVRERPAAQLFSALVDGYRSRGATVLVPGIATVAELRVTLDSGADWLSGPLLAPSALAGAVFPEDTLQIESLLDQGKVVPLFR
jgi:predicted signal transduction protein with EAL and GGDEF domain